MLEQELKRRQIFKQGYFSPSNKVKPLDHLCFTGFSKAGKRGG